MSDECLHTLRKFFRYTSEYSVSPGSFHYRKNKPFLQQAVANGFVQFSKGRGKVVYLLIKDIQFKTLAPCVFEPLHKKMSSQKCNVSRRCQVYAYYSFLSLRGNQNFHSIIHLKN